MVAKSYRRLQLLILLCAAVSQTYRAILKNDRVIWLDQPPHFTDNSWAI